jgi:predicted dehydrogenase
MDYRFHPSIQRVKEILESKELGAIKNISVTMVLPRVFFKDNDIRFDYTLGGGAMMDLGCGLLLFFQKMIRKLTIDKLRLYR